MSVREQRTFPVELRAASAEGEAPRLVGYAAKFDRESEDLGGFIEVIRPGAFRRAVKEDDVRCLHNHDANYILGRTKSGTLRLEEDEIGLRIEVEPPDTQWARDLAESIRRGDVDQMSFAFATVSDRWIEREGEPVLRELLEVRLYDVSPVVYPAYEDTEISVRDLVAGRELTAEERAALAPLLDEPAPEPITTSIEHQRRRLRQALV